MIGICQVNIGNWLTEGKEYELLEVFDNEVKVLCDDGVSAIVIMSNLFQIKAEETMKEEYKLFGELSPEEQGALLLAHHNDETIEVYGCDCGWKVCIGMPSWFTDLRYRVKPKELTKPSINWSHVHPDYKWMATDSDGDTFLSKEKPVNRDGLWETVEVPLDHTCFVDAEGFVSFVKGTCAPEDSLVERPHV